MTHRSADEPRFTSAEIDRVAALLEGRGKPQPRPACRTRMIAIDGRSGAGKSTLAESVAEATGAAVVSLEYLYGGWHDLEGGSVRAFESAIEPLASGETAVIPQFDWIADAWGDPLLVEPGGSVIIEGAGAFTKRAEPFLQAGIWLDAPEAVRRLRADARDQGAFATWWAVWAAQEDLHFREQATQARATVTLLTG